MIMLLDIIAGPLFVMAVSGDSPTPPTLLGGACLVMTLVGKQSLAACDHAQSADEKERSRRDVEDKD